MTWTLGPTFKPGQEVPQLLFGAIGLQSAMALPVYIAQLAQPEGEIIEFSAAGETKPVPVPVPRLAGLDDLEVERMSFDLSSIALEDEQSVSGQGVSSGNLTVSYNPSPANAPARLARVEIQDLSVAATGSTSYVVQGDGLGGSDSRVVYTWDSDNERVAANVDGAVGSAEYVHFLVRPAGNGGFGPPMAAAPHFDMPGKGGSMYGPALGGASLSVFHDSAGKIKAVLKFNPPLQTSTFQLLLGRPAEDNDKPHGGVPNDVEGVNWSAQTVVARYDVYPAGVTVKAAVANGSDEPLVARFDTDPGPRPVNTDFAPVARSLLRAAYPSSSGADLGLQLNFTCDSPGKLRVNLAQAAARYLRFPLANDSVNQTLRGVPEFITLSVPQGLRPAGVSFTIDGSYGPARLVAAADGPLVDSRRGFRIAGGARLARRMSLTEIERNLPLARVALFGRASEAGELLVSLHRGDELRIGPAIGAPVSFSLAPSPNPIWYRADFPANAMLPPQPEAVWVVAQATGGVFWWHADMAAAGPAQRSDDAGASWNTITARPALQLAVIEIDPATGNPSPLEPLKLTWVDGVLNGDLVGVGQAGPLSPQFRRYWLAQSEAHLPFLNRIPELGGLLQLGFECRRDVDFSLRDVVLVYNPWQAGET
jgi:hypothetical protein